MGSNPMIEHTMERAAELMEELEASNARLAKNLDAANELLEKAEANNDLLLDRAQKAEAMAAARLETNLAYKRTIAGLIQGIDPVKTYDAFSTVSLILSAATEFEKRGELCQVQIARDNDRPVGITLGVLNKHVLNGPLRAVGDARLLSLTPGKDFGTRSEFEQNQEKP